MIHARLLVVHHDNSTRELLISMLQTLGHRIEEAASDSAAVRLLDRSEIDLVVAGADPTDPDSLELLTYVRRKHPGLGCILLFSLEHADRSKEAGRLGASAVFRFPVSANCLRAAVTQALEQSVRKQAPQPERSQKVAASPYGQAPSASGIHAAYAFGGPLIADRSANATGGERNGRPQAHVAAAESANFGDAPWVGEDPAMESAYETARAAAGSRTPVHVVGERGTGKTLLARFIHQSGPRAKGPFVKMSTAGLKEQSLEIELFGKRGPEGDVPGRIQAAHNGTLYIDDVTSLSLRLQAKLAHFLQTGEFEPAGLSRGERADVRVICGSLEPLSARAADGTFRDDLYYRLSVLSAQVPPLRSRGKDIERLAYLFRDRFSRDQGKEAAEFGMDAADLLRVHSWPGNVRELETAIERAVILCKTGRISAPHLGLSSASGRDLAASAGSGAAKPAAGSAVRPLKEALEEPEKQIILHALESLNWNRQETARVLDINRTTLYKKMKKYRLLIDEPAWV